MDGAWCENIKVVQNSMAIWPSNGWTLGILFSLIGAYVLYFYSKSELSKYGYIVGLLFILIGGTWWLLILDERSLAVTKYNSYSRFEVIGHVSNIQVEVYETKFGATYELKIYNAEDLLMPRGYRNQIMFNVDDKRVVTDVNRLSLFPGNRCNGLDCELKNGDLVRISSTPRNWRLRKNLEERQKSQRGFNNPLKIERCDDPL